MPSPRIFPWYFFFFSVVPDCFVKDIFTNISESELFTGDTIKDNHSAGPVIRVISP